MSKKYCPLCTKKNKGIVPKFYSAGEERCENDGIFLRETLVSFIASMKFDKGDRSENPLIIWT